jgi:hypothetical protein
MEHDVARQAPLWEFLRSPEALESELHQISPDTTNARIAAAREQLEAEGRNLDEELAAATERVRDVEYPTPECLTPARVALILVAPQQATVADLAHASTCEFCTRVLHAAQPDEEYLKQFLATLRSMGSQAGARYAVMQGEAALSRLALLRSPNAPGQSVSSTG